MAGIFLPIINNIHPKPHSCYFDTHNWLINLTNKLIFCPPLSENYHQCYHQSFLHHQTTKLSGTRVHPWLRSQIFFHDASCTLETALNCTVGLPLPSMPLMYAAPWASKGLILFWISFCPCSTKLSLEPKRQDAKQIKSKLIMIQTVTSSPHVGGE